MNKFVRIALAVMLAAIMCVSAVADVPSVTQGADVSTGTYVTVDEEGNEVEIVGYTVYDADGNEVSVAGAIVVTPYLNRADLTTEKREDIEAAYAQLLGIEDLSDLLDQLPEGTVALYLFDISAYDEAAEYLNAGGSADVILECDLGDASTVVVLHNYEDNLWRQEPSEVISSNQVKVTITSTSPYVVAVSDGIYITEPVEGSIFSNSGVDVATATTTSSAMPYVIGGVACIVIAGVLLIVANKKKVN